MKLTKELQCSTIAELIYIECLKQGVELCEDEHDLENILLSAAESILMGYGEAKDLRDIVGTIESYVAETKINYPNFFRTGDETTT